MLRVDNLLKISIDGRVRIIGVGDAYIAPGVCILCREAPSSIRKFIDFGMSMPRHGRIYFCNFCFSEIAKAVGFVRMTGSQWEEARNYIESLESECTSLRASINEFAELFKHVDSFYNLWLSKFSSDSSDSYIDNNNIEDVQESSSELHESVDGGTREIEPSNKSIDESGSSDISSDAERNILEQLAF